MIGIEMKLNIPVHYKMGAYEIKNKNLEEGGGRRLYVGSGGGLAFCNVSPQNLTLGYMTKTLTQIIFFPPPKSEYFFSNIGNQNIFF
jgi:hypothetical protein